ncbi:MAG: peptidase MA family metallohydrolase [Candidatus Omnitrophota bacterium]|nr:peptidase MA family metallohydrolase [Candidatus Omnitrophota bacterium]
MERKSNFSRYATVPLFLILSGVVIPVLADELATSDGKHYEGVIVNQSPSSVTVRLKEGTMTFKRSDLKYIKKWSRQENGALTEKWSASSASDGSSQGRDEELKFSDTVRYSDKPWQIYEEDAFIAFHHDEGIVRGRLKGKVGDYCKRVADKFGYEEFKIYDESASPDWDLKFKFYSYGDFASWKKAAQARGFNPDTLMAFAAGNRRVFFYELYMKTDVIYHEIAHEIYRELTKEANIPRWWSEGIAQYALLTTGEARRDISNSRFRAMNNQHIPLLSPNNDSYEHNYEDGLSVVYFLARDKGKDRFKEFNYNLRKGKGFENSLFEVYGFDNIGALDRAWVEYLKKMDVKDMVGE